MKVIIDFDGTLTCEETQVQALAEKSIATLADEIIGVPRTQLRADYDATQARMLEAPFRYWWEVRGLIASYCDEGAFILNTTTLQVMLREKLLYRQAVESAFPRSEYDPVVDCTNYLFHRHTAELPPVFRPAARDVLRYLILSPRHTPIILTNSLGDKVQRQLATLGVRSEVAVLGDTRQYDMDPSWEHLFHHPQLGEIQIWNLDGRYHVDLRRPVYYRALTQAAEDGSSLAVVADTFSLPGALPLMMGIPFFLLRTAYTPDWCAGATAKHALGHVVDELGQLPAVLDSNSI